MALDKITRDILEKALEEEVKELPFLEREQYLKKVATKLLHEVDYILLPRTISYH